MRAVQSRPRAPLTAVSVVWLSRLLWEQEDGSSNLSPPTIFMLSSSRGLGLRIFTPATRVQFPLRVPLYNSRWLPSVSTLATSGPALVVESSLLGNKRGPRRRTPYGLVAQLRERLICIQEVAGLIPVESTTFALVAQR